ncbi:PilZ domain-containing protein [Catenovulum maritimum]|uniref:Cyclic diguanosine monophosphate-binding protein n=1 Tax=Catenovulum maritimum TaxID=1513271 RepID=A0A0J8JIC9_9ALTE|nr:PilZ domain-containing protein [Catenovulum maritimum]KMT64211.1 hypothetical protein XM47_15705 [Catenovulum maritimum]
MDERREFTRIFFSTPAQLSLQSQTWDVNIIDLSLKGALISQPENQQSLTIDAHEYTLSFVLPNSEIEIQMSVKLAHVDSIKIGLRTHHLDIDSASHLKRLVELNMNDISELYRELENLSHPESDVKHEDK